MIAHWTRSNLDNFSVYELTEYIMDTLIMNMAKFNILVAKSLIADNGHDDYAHFERAIKDHGDELLEEDVLAEQKKILDQHRLKGIVNSTVYKWIAYLGFRHKDYQKSFNCEGHEAEDTVRDRVQYVLDYLKLERRAHRWVLVKHSELDALIIEEKVVPHIRKFGTDVTETLCARSLLESQPDEKTYEFHVDTSEHFIPFVTNQEFRGDLSCRMMCVERPVLIIGQDESAFEQNLYASGTWVDSDGKGAIRPKGAGYGLMVSAFVSREFGLGLKVTPDQLGGKIKDFRKEQRYCVPRCVELLGMDIEKDKNVLDCDPSIEFFDYGKNNQGYWRSENMAIQTEDVCDCLSVLVPHMMVVFLFDHSSGHSKAQDDGLKASNLNVSYGGRQTHIRNTHKVIETYPPKTKM